MVFSKNTARPRLQHAACANRKTATGLLDAVCTGAYCPDAGANAMITNLLLPLGLAFMMFSIGLTLRFSDFIRVFIKPGFVLTGLACQIVLLPMFAFLLLHIWNMEPVLAVGIMILAASPGGITSNLLTHFAKGDTALSISLTAISSLAGMFSAPLVVGFALHYFTAAHAPQEILVWRMMAGVFAVSTLPVMVGILVNQANPILSDRIEDVARPASILIFAIIVIGAFTSQWTEMSANLPVIGAPILLLNIAVMTLGYYLATGVGADKASARAISLEAGLQNGAMGIFVAVSLIGDAKLAIPSITYALIMNVTAAVFILAVQYYSRHLSRT
ncbi:MAG: bile acid:sodium symporter family protein [Hyphomicrobiales bacterium]|nr:bile acid:sodium symporter family protein [Hyphomicrobiales bacterium]